MPNTKEKRKFRRVRNKLMILEFENSIYTNPEQDFNGLWWDLVRKYEMLDVPDQKLPAAWSSVRHIILQSGSFQNYLVGDLIAAQFLQYIKKNCYTEGKNLYVGNKEIGKFFREKVFYYGNAKNWYQLIEEATGEKLNAGYYLDYLVEKE
jgi:Zn-dependent M32 family carboxypeptidase